jgi:hypothetical protein
MTTDLTRPRLDLGLFCGVVKLVRVVVGIGHTRPGLGLVVCTDLSLDGFNLIIGSGSRTYALGLVCFFACTACAEVTDAFTRIWSVAHLDS